MGKLILALIVFFVFYGLVLIFYKPKTKESGLDVVIFEINEGFGYKILNKDKILIKQDFIPAIPEKKAFQNIRDAELVANLVKHRIIHGQSPVIQIKDLENLNINIMYTPDRPQ